jgi:hypothetical protein
MPNMPGISKRDLTYSGVTAGAPAVIAPSGTRAPYALKDLKSDLRIGDAGTAKPTDAWAAGEYVALRSGTLATWNGTAWVSYIRSVTPGSPGAFVPADAALPADLTALAAHVVVGDSGSNTAIGEWAGRVWSELEWLVLGDDSLANWDGSQWVEFSTVAYSVTAGDPGSFGPEGVDPPADLDALIAHPVIGDAGCIPETTAWDAGDHVELGDESLATWDGDGWVVYVPA